MPRHGRAHEVNAAMIQFLRGLLRPSNRWHLDGMVVRIASQRMYLWHAVDHESEVLDMLVQRQRDSRAALRLMRKLLKKQVFAPKLLVTNKLRSYASAGGRAGGRSDRRGRSRGLSPLRQCAAADGLSQLGALRTFGRLQHQARRHHQGRQCAGAARADRGSLDSN